MSKLPTMPYSSGIGKLTQVQFGGLRHHINCGDGEFFDMQNLTAEKYPVLTVRKKRSEEDIPISGSATQIYADNGMILLVDATGDIDYFDALWHGFTYPIAKTKDPKNVKFVRFGDRVIMMPDKQVLNMKYRLSGQIQSTELLPESVKDGTAYAVGGREPPFEVFVFMNGEWVSNGNFSAPMEQLVKVTTITILDGVIYGEQATANSIAISEEIDLRDLFKAGDAVQISGLKTVPQNNKTAIIREVEKHILRFSDNCFRMPQSESGEEINEYEETGNIRIERTIPNMDIIFEHENRLWGAKGKEIFASKLGDPFNWNVFDGLSTDSFYLQTQDKGEITAGISFGYPRFFREDSMTTVYGSMPSAFQTQVTELLGVKQGEQLSLERMCGILLWLSNKGIVMYDGDQTYLQDQVFGDWKLSKVISQADAAKCYLHADIEPHPMADGKRMPALFCYDATKGIWTKEDDPEIKSMTYMNGVIYALTGSKIIKLDREGYESYQIDSFAEFGDFTDGSPNRKAVSKVQLRLEIEEGAFVLVKIRYNSSGEWMTVKQIEAGKKRSVYLPVIPHRCDHYRIRIEGSGGWTLYSMARELYVGSAVH